MLKSESKKRKKTVKKKVQAGILQIHRQFCSLPWYAEVSFKIGLPRLLYYDHNLRNLALYRNQIIYPLT